MLMYADMHVHSSFSIDGTSKMEEYCTIAASKGVSAICFTEHVDFNKSEKNLDIVKDNRVQNFVIDMLIEHGFMNWNKRCLKQPFTCSKKQLIHLCKENRLWKIL